MGHWHRSSRLGPLQGLRGNVSSVGPPASVLGLLIAVDVRWAGVWRMEEGGEGGAPDPDEPHRSPFYYLTEGNCCFGDKKKKKSGLGSTLLHTCPTPWPQVLFLLLPFLPFPFCSSPSFPFSCLHPSSLCCISSFPQLAAAL